MVEAGNLKVTGYHDGFNVEHLKDDTFPGSQNVTEFYGFQSWAGVSLGVNLYGIMEEGYKACFTTKSGVAVTTCEVVESSSSVEISSSSIQSSSSWPAYSSEESSSSSSYWPWFSSESQSSSSYDWDYSSSSEFENPYESSVDKLPVVAADRGSVSLTVHGTMVNVVAPPGRKKLEVFDAQGHLVYRKLFSGSAVSVDLSGFLSGSFAVVRVTAGKKLLAVEKAYLRK